MQRKEAARSGRMAPRAPSYPVYTPPSRPSVPDTYDSYEAEKKKSFAKWVLLCAYTQSISLMPQQTIAYPWKGYATWKEVENHRHL